MSKIDSKRVYLAPRIGEVYPGTVDEDSYHLELWEEIPTLFRSRMTDEEFESFARLDDGVKFEDSPLSNHLYLTSTELDDTTCYFNDEDLFQRLDDDYDYPQEVDDEYDTFMGDLLYQDGMWMGSEEVTGVSGQDSQTLPEDALGSRRFFNVNDHGDRGDPKDSVYCIPGECVRSETPTLEETEPYYMDDDMEEAILFEL